MMFSLLLADTVGNEGLFVGVIGWLVIFCGISLVVFFLRHGVQKTIPPEGHAIRDAFHRFFGPRTPHGGHT